MSATAFTATSRISPQKRLCPYCECTRGYEFVRFVEDGGCRGQLPEFECAGCGDRRTLWEGPP